MLILTESFTKDGRLRRSKSLCCSQKHLSASSKNLWKFLSLLIFDRQTSVEEDSDQQMKCITITKIRFSIFIVVTHLGGNLGEFLRGSASCALVTLHGIFFWEENFSTNSVRRVKNLRKFIKATIGILFQSLIEEAYKIFLIRLELVCVHSRPMWGMEVPFWRNILLSNEPLPGGINLKLIAFVS